MLLHFHMADLSAARRLVLKLGNPGLGYWVDATLRWLLCLMMGKWHQIRWRCHEHFDRASSCRPLQAAKPVIKATALKYVIYLGKIIMQNLTPVWMQFLICLGLALQQQFFSCSCFCLCWCSTILQLWVHWSQSFDFRFLREEHLHLHEKEKKRLSCIRFIHSLPLSPSFFSPPPLFSSLPAPRLGDAA